jgi:hypothetical protein
MSQPIKKVDQAFIEWSQRGEKLKLEQKYIFDFNDSKKSKIEGFF